MAGPTAFGSLSAVLTDVVAWVVATDLASLGRYNFGTGEGRWGAISVVALMLGAGQVAVGAPLQMYRGRYRTGSFDELRALAVAATTVAVIAAALVAIVRPDGVPRSVPFLAWPLALFAMSVVRGVKRMLIQAERRPPKGAERIVVLGAGEAGVGLIQQMLRNPGSPLRPVALLDDDPAKRNLQIQGVRVRGRFADLAVVARALDATKVVVAVSDADSTLLRQIADAADAAGLGCLVIPPLKDVLHGHRIRLSALREIDVEDVIGRRPVEIDVKAIVRYVTGRRVLVTGAGGSVGSELCRQLHKFGPSQLLLLDRDESALHAVALSIYGRALLESPDLLLVDIRDRAALDEVFVEHEPQVVFHAAALKHLTLLERYPHEALLSNVYGTLNVLEAAAATGVERFVNISTDKAVNPTSALGHSKRLAERLTAWFALTQPDGAQYLSVRFGNVLGSRGSALHSFAAQIEAGGPITVTHPDVTRFFMTIPEACQLVIQAGAIGRGGEALVLDMGDPVKIVDVAVRMIAMSGKDIDIVFTGLRPGEKMHEHLFDATESGSRPFHPLISHVDIAPLAPGDIAAQPWARAATRRRPAAVVLASPSSR
jgi:FlaA1/EpsC-like NDP-sugar epimerase